MGLSVEDLRAQRDLVKRHLEWLEQQIARAEEGTSVPGVAPLEAKANPMGETGLGGSSVVVGEADSPSASEGRRGDGLSGGETRGRESLPMGFRAGCIAVIVVSGLLFLATLFLLPYLLYG